MTYAQIRPKYVSVLHSTAVGVKDRWRQQYQLPDGSWKMTDKESSERVYDRLCELEPTPTIEAVEAIIGNDSWTSFRCDGCSTYVRKAVKIGDDTYGNECHTYCETCVREAASVLSAV